MKIKYEIGGNRIGSHSVDDDLVRYENGYAVIKFKPLDGSSLVFLTIIDKNKNIVIPPTPVYTSAIILPDGTALVTECAQDNLIDLIMKRTVATTTVHIDLKGNEPGKKIIDLGNEYDCLPNGNLIIRGHIYKGFPVEFIYDIANRKIVSPYMSKISDFNTDSLTGKFCATASVVFGEDNNTPLFAPIAEGLPRYKLFGRMNQDGDFISNMFNTATNSLIDTRNSELTIQKEVSKSQKHLQYIRTRDDEKVSLAYVPPTKVRFE